MVLERCYNDLRLLNVSSKTLKAEGFFRSNKVHALGLNPSFLVCVFACCVVQGMAVGTELILGKCHMFCSVICGVSAQCSAADEYSGLVVKPSVHRRECIENQTSGCYSGADGAELNSLMMKTVKSQAFLGKKD